MNNITEIRRTLELFKPNGNIEIRTVSRPIKSGYFNSCDDALKAIERYPNDTLYFVMNEINDACFSRKQLGKIIEHPKETTGDKDIINRDWILIDCDPVRTSGVSSTKAEKEKSKEVRDYIYWWLHSQGFSDPIIADSSNGYHLLYKIELPNGEAEDKGIKEFLMVLDMLFSNDDVKIDTTVCNASRITKLYGVVTKKGTHTEERPHRQSKILRVPDEIKLTSVELIKKVADKLPKPEPPKYRNNYGGNTFDLQAFMSRHGITVKKTASWSGGTRYILDHCVFDSNHKAPDAMITQAADGAIGFKCFHNSCQGYEWKHVRERFEPDAYSKKYEPRPTPNHKRTDYAPKPFPEQAPPQQNENKPKRPVFLTFEEIRKTPRPITTFIKTGITDLDRKIRGLAKGEISLLSGLTGAGKTSIITQIVLEAAQQGYRAAMYSGELKDDRAYRWTLKRAAGRNHVVPTNNERYYEIDKDAELKISKWLNDKAYIYNNEYGHNYEFIQSTLTEIVKEKKVDLIILDNLMTMDIVGLAFDVNSQQTAFVNRLKAFAEANDVHIMFVAHPKKINERRLIDKYDVCGSSNIVNLVDSLFIIYRNTDAYRAFKKKEFKNAPDEDVGSELRICKDREGGAEDYFIPLYYEKESQRLNNTPHEYRNYGWNNFADILMGGKEIGAEDCPFAAEEALTIG